MPSSEVVSVLGKSGSGKSTSLRNFKRGEIGVFSVGGKRMPFKTDFPVVDLGPLRYQERYELIERTLKANNLRCYVIDDATFLQADENLERALDKGDQYRKFLEIGVHLANIVQVASQLNEDTIVYFMFHIDVDDYGTESIRSIGKLVDEKYNPIERCNVVLDAVVRDGEHLFVTKNDGHNLAKTPMDMDIPTVMENDLAAVDDVLRDYWGMGPRAEKGE